MRNDPAVCCGPYRSDERDGPMPSSIRFRGQWRSGESEGEPRCPRAMHHMRRSTGGEWSNWRARGVSPDELAREFEPTAKAIRKWVKQADSMRAVRSDGLTSDERAGTHPAAAREPGAARRARDTIKSRGLVRDGDRLGAVTAFEFVSANQAMYRLRRCAGCWGSPPADTTRGAKRSPSARARADAELSSRMRAIHQRSRATYGAPRIHAELQAKASGWDASGWRG